MSPDAAIWHNWLIGAPVKRSLIAYHHVAKSLGWDIPAARLGW